MAKEKEKAIGVMQPGAMIKWATDADREIARRIPNGSTVVVEMKYQDRNLAHHRKAFALLNLGFQYYQPEVKLISDAERWIAHKVASLVGKHAGDKTLYENVTKAIAEEAIGALALHRSEKYDPELVKTPEAFREKMLIAAGFYDEVVQADGGARKQAHSMSFAGMSQQRFNEVYKGLFGAIWNEVLFRHFANEDEMQQAVNQLEGFI